MSIEKLESQLNTLKTMFAEKQKLVADLEAFGPGGRVLSPGGQQAKTEPEQPEDQQPAVTGTEDQVQVST